jgi:streptogramin lyase
LVGVAVGENAVWAVGTNGEVARIDPETNEVAKLIGTGNGATRVVIGLGAVWLLNPTLGTVTRIDPETNAVVATIHVGKGATALAAGEGSVWITQRAG